MSEEHDAPQPTTEDPPLDYSGQIPQPPAKTDTDQLVESWWDSHVRGSVVGQHTQIWNHMVVCKDKLKAMLRGESA